MNLFITCSLFFAMNICVWFATNYQFIENVKGSTALKLCLALAIPTSLCAFYASKFGFMAFESVWSIRLLAFGISYLSFPVLTYVILGESPFTAKTMTCIFLSALIVCAQVFWPNS